MASKYEHGEIRLPYHKQGSDFGYFLEQCGNDPVAALRAHAGMLKHSAKILEDVAEAIQQDLPQAVASKLSNHYPVKISGDTHCIWIDGDPKVIKKLVKRDLAEIPEYE